jgi:diguanylate cyclase (GGDEF)-like protein
VLGDVAGAALAAGALACLAAAAPRRGRRAARAAWALALALAAAAEIGGGADALLGALAAGAAAGGAVLAVLERFGSVSRLSWLDAAMGATASGALAAVLGADTPLVVAVAGAAGALALSRWQPSPSLLLAAAGTLALGDAASAAAAAVLLPAAAWRREPRAARGPEFRWTVLAAVILFASVALALLALGQFTDLRHVGGALAIATVIAGMARAGITVTDRLRDSERRASTDELTGLGNRRDLVAKLDAALRGGGPVALLLIDLDGFKELNDTLGHHAGDQVLRQIGPRLAGALRERTALARLGGDEFAVVLAPGDEATASAAGLAVRAALEGSFAVEGIAVHVDASVGIALYPAHGADAIGLLRSADVAMYEAKRMRTGHEVYLAARDRHSRDRLGLIGELRGAIDADRLVLHYQPKASLRTGAVEGVEALVRWRHPRRGLLEPGQFLPLAEQSGLTRALTAWVLDRALTEIGAYRAGGRELSVAVNLGPVDLLDSGLPGEVARLLERRGFPAGALRLEVSEDLVMADPQRTTEVLDRLRALGVAVGLDDFGAGQSSFTHLKELRLDELKVDRGFVLGMERDPRDAAIVRTTIDLGRRLGLRVVGEGVESAAAWEALAAAGCDEAQGTFLSPPLPMEGLRTWLGARPGAVAGPPARST